MLADGWYRGSVGAWGMKNYYGSETKLLAQIEVVFEDNTVDIITTDDSFQWTNEGPIRFADNKDGEIYDALKIAADKVELEGVSAQEALDEAAKTAQAALDKVNAE